MKVGDVGGSEGIWGNSSATQVYLPPLCFLPSETITALFKTRFRLDFPFDLQELPAFAVIG